MFFFSFLSLNNINFVLDINTDLSVQFRSQIIGQIPPRKIYLKEVKRTALVFKLRHNDMFAVPECVEDGNLNLKKFCLLQALCFSADDKVTDVLFVCSCTKASAQHDRLLNTNTRINEDWLNFLSREKDQYCHHAYAGEHLCKELVSPGTDEDTKDESSDLSEMIDQLSSEPLLVAVFDEDSYGIVGLDRYNTKQRLVCKTCCVRTTATITHCSHVDIYRDWCTTEGLEPELTATIDEGDTPGTPIQFTSMSYNRIPYPLPENLKQKHDDIAAGLLHFPEHLVPTVSDSRQHCSHKNAWSMKDPIEEKWVEQEGVVIYRTHTVLTKTPSGSSRTVYYRPTVDNSCDCKLYYDGLNDLLFNLNNREMFDLGCLFQYMHSSIEGKNPLAAAHRAYTRNHEVLSNTTNKMPYKSLRLAWNGFARLLDIDYNSSFRCQHCGDNPDTIICDATFMGFRKDLLPAFAKQQASSRTTTPIVGSKHADRVFLNHKKSRDLLARITGIEIARGSRGRRKKLVSGKGLNKKEYNELLKWLEEADQLELKAVIQEAIKSCKGKYSVTPEYADFLFELSRNGPACGMIQIAGDSHAIQLLEDICAEKLDVFDSRNHDALSYLQKVAPLAANFMCSLSKVSSFSANARSLLGAVLTRVLAPFDGHHRSKSSSAEPIPEEDPLSFFPNLPRLSPREVYKADKNAAKNNPIESGCRKESYGHPTLSPGLFTIFCKHGICYGFEAMTSHESPRHPFNIFRTRFNKAPRNIIYDNACQLHTYCLNREPEFFKNTVFHVDRFHWKCHVGCSEGYCLDQYKACQDVQQINSQINEQANSGLRRISPQLSYMTPINFMFHTGLFLAIKNRDKQNLVHIDIIKGLCKLKL